MRVTLPCLLLVAACGGSSQKTTTPANTTPVQPAVPVAPAEDPKAACATQAEEFGPFMLTAEQAANRYGATATKFSDAPTTKLAPIEVCGIAGQHAWLMKTTCADGSKAFADRGQIPGSRRGNVGAGGRCGAIIDLYIAKCPEAAYEVHVDMYMCGPGDQF
jgi:hypothetical protein